MDTCCEEEGKLYDGFTLTRGYIRSRFDIVNNELDQLNEPLDLNEGLEQYAKARELLGKLEELKLFSATAFLACDSCVFRAKCKVKFDTPIKT